MWYGYYGKIPERIKKNRLLAEYSVKVNYLVNSNIIH